MIALQDIKKEYGLNIPKKIKIKIARYIQEDKIQEYIYKALNYILTEQDIDNIFKIGKNKDNAEYPYLYWLCCIYIHPLTKGQYILNNWDKIERR